MATKEWILKGKYDPIVNVIGLCSGRGSWANWNVCKLYEYGIHWNGEVAKRWSGVYVITIRKELLMLTWLSFVLIFENTHPNCIHRICDSDAALSWKKSMNIITQSLYSWDNHTFGTYYFSSISESEQVWWTHLYQIFHSGRIWMFTKSSLASLLPASTFTFMLCSLHSQVSGENVFLILLSTICNCIEWVWNENHFSCWR